MSPSSVWHTGREVGREGERKEAWVKGKHSERQSPEEVNII